jgi:hypothetical protein
VVVGFAVVEKVEAADEVGLMYLQVLDYEHQELMLCLDQ